MIFNNTSMVVESWLIACACKIIIKHAKKSRSERNHIYLYSRSLKQYTKIHSNSLKKIVNKMNVIRNAKNTRLFSCKLNWIEGILLFFFTKWVPFWILVRSFYSYTDKCWLLPKKTSRWKWTWLNTDLFLTDI